MTRSYAEDKEKASRSSGSEVKINRSCCDWLLFGRSGCRQGQKLRKERKIKEYMFHSMNTTNKERKGDRFWSGFEGKFNRLAVTHCLLVNLGGGKGQKLRRERKDMNTCFTRWIRGTKRRGDGHLKSVVVERKVNVLTDWLPLGWFGKRRRAKAEEVSAEQSIVGLLDEGLNIELFYKEHQSLLLWLSASD